MNPPAPFPGRWVGGAALLLAPLLMLAGVLLRFQFHFFFPQQLAAYQEHPVLIRTAYQLFVAGNVLLWPALVVLASCIAEKRPVWGILGGVLAVTGLFGRTFHAGVDHLAFQLVTVQGLNTATGAVAASYGAFHIFQWVSFAILIGWPVLAIGAWRSGVLPPWRCCALALMTTLMMGVLKGSTVTSVVAVAGLTLALVPLGFQLLRGR